MKNERLYKKIETGQMNRLSEICQNISDVIGLKVIPEFSDKTESIIIKKYNKSLKLTCLSTPIDGAWFDLDKSDWMK